jgi:exodeoxyribonuclease VII large subunit
MPDTNPFDLDDFDNDDSDASLDSTLAGDSLAPPEPVALSVGEVTRQIKDALEGDFPEVLVMGELSNLSRASSGHVYLTLKDDEAQLRAVLWRNVAQRLKFELRDGLEVIAAGPIEVYAARGTYQLVIRDLLPRGMGPLELAFRQLQEKLAREGLFDPARKRPLPRFPRRIALVTSPTGAAVRDLLQVLTRRWKATDLVIVPVPVQGEGAAAKIAAALRRIGSIPNVDLVITGRGGGSLEDLWPFNEEVVARAIADCPVPVISAVGHEIDVTIADLVADRRALTPSEAGELAVPNGEELAAWLADCRERLRAGLTRKAELAGTRLEAIAQRRGLSRPFDLIDDRTQRLDEVEQRLRQAMQTRLTAAESRLALGARALSALSPLAVLARGYSVTTDAATGRVLQSAQDASPNQLLETRLASGRIRSRIVELDT